MQAPPPQPAQPPPPQQVFNAYPPQPQPVGIPQAQQPSTMSAIHQQPVYPNTDVTGCKMSGGFQIVIGILTLIFGIVAICIECEYSYFGTAIWGGVWFLVCGFIGATAVRASGSSAQCQLTGYLILCIFSVIYALDLVVTMSIAIPSEGPPYFYNNSGYFVTSSQGARIAIDSIILVFGILEVGGACWGVAVASKTVCGTRHQTVVTTQPVVAYTTTTSGPGYYGNPPGTVAVTTQYTYTNQNPHPGPPMQSQGLPGAYPPPYQQKAPIGQL